MSGPMYYTFGWIYAPRMEHVSLQAFFDEKHNRPEYTSAKDSNYYTLGKIGEHNTVIIVLLNGEYGTASTAIVERDILYSFLNIRISLMVGIGGGAPTQQHDIRLSDIVVSALRDRKGGVFQYDSSKTRQDQSFRPTGLLMTELERVLLPNQQSHRQRISYLRGTCDYLDSHKNKEWQGYAVMAAAAFTKMLLSGKPIERCPQQNDCNRSRRSGIWRWADIQALLGTPGIPGTRKTGLIIDAFDEALDEQKEQDLLISPPKRLGRELSSVPGRMTTRDASTVSTEILLPPVVSTSRVTFMGSLRLPLWEKVYRRLLLRRCPAFKAPKASRAKISFDEAHRRLLKRLLDTTFLNSIEFIQTWLGIRKRQQKVFDRFPCLSARIWLDIRKRWQELFGCHPGLSGRIRQTRSLGPQSLLAPAIWFVSPVFADDSVSKSSVDNRHDILRFIKPTDLLSSYGIRFPLTDFIGTPSSLTFGSAFLIYFSAALVFHRFNKDHLYQNHLLVVGMFCGMALTIATTNGAGLWGPFLVYVPGCISIALAISAVLHRAVAKRHAQSSEEPGEMVDSGFVDTTHGSTGGNIKKANGE